MKVNVGKDKQGQLISKLNHLWKEERDHALIANTIQALDTRHNLIRKITKEPGVEEIIQQMFGRLANSFAKLADVRDTRILDIACGSNSSKAPPSISIDTPFGGKTIGRSNKGYTAQFEPWF